MAEYEELDMETETDAAYAPEEELAEEQEPESESLESLSEAEKPAEEQTGSNGTSEPGWIKQRIQKALAQESERMRADIRAEYEQQFAPLRERLLEMDAQDLVRKGVVKDLEVAKELVRYRQGHPQPVQQAQQAQPAEQPRNERGQFAKQSTPQGGPQDDPAIQARVNMLSHQADSIKQRTGLDVIDVFNKDEDIKQKVISGEMDFYDVAEQVKNRPARRKPPAPMRSPNGASGQTNPNAIDTMSDEAFDRMEKRIKEGARYALK